MMVTFTCSPTTNLCPSPPPLDPNFRDPTTRRVAPHPPGRCIFREKRPGHRKTQAKCLPYGHQYDAAKTDFGPDVMLDKRIADG
jgi:hypothetical protein